MSDLLYWLRLPTDTTGTGPFELTKLSAQVSVLMAGNTVHSSVSDPTGGSNVAASYQNKGTWKTAKNIIHNRGIGGLYSGFSLHLRKYTHITARLHGLT